MANERSDFTNNTPHGGPQGSMPPGPASAQPGSADGQLPCSRACGARLSPAQRRLGQVVLAGPVLFWVATYAAFGGWAATKAPMSALILLVGVIGWPLTFLEYARATRGTRRNWPGLLGAQGWGFLLIGLWFCGGLLVYVSLVELLNVWEHGLPALLSIGVGLVGIAACVLSKAIGRRANQAVQAVVESMGNAR